MRRETYLLKQILHQEYSDAKISVRLKKATNYIDSSDKLIVSVDGYSVVDIICTLCHYTRNISIYKEGAYCARSGICDPQIYNIETGKFESADCCEFIEIR